MSSEEVFGEPPTRQRGHSGPVSRDTSLIARLNRQGLHYCLERPSDV